jgi:hypothetical protein
MLTKMTATITPFKLDYVNLLVEVGSTGNYNSYRIDTNDNNVVNDLSRASSVNNIAIFLGMTFKAREVTKFIAKVMEDVKAAEVNSIDNMIESRGWLEYKGKNKGGCVISVYIDAVGDKQATAEAAGVHLSLGDGIL